MIFLLESSSIFIKFKKAIPNVPGEGVPGSSKPRLDGANNKWGSLWKPIPYWKQTF
jgi:hypothetical protein